MILIKTVLGFKFLPKQKGKKEQIALIEILGQLESNQDTGVKNIINFVLILNCRNILSLNR